MNKHPLYRCHDCGAVTVSPTCLNGPTHTVRTLSDADADNYVLIGHDAFTAIAEPKADDA